MKIGFGCGDITPRGGRVSLVGQFEARYSEKILDPLCASVMLVQSGDSRAVFLTLDTLQPYEFATKAIYEELKKLIPDLRENELIVSATHIHTGPGFTPSRRELPEGVLTGEECAQQSLPGIAAAVSEALADLREAKVELAYAYILTGVCRLVGYADGYAEMYGDPHLDSFRRILGRDGGPTQILYVSDAKTGELTGIAAAVPCTAQCDEMAKYVTADYWGVVRSCLAEKYGEKVKLLPLCRAAGDLSPHHIVDLMPGYESFGGRREALWLGNHIAKAIVDNRENILCTFEGDVPFRAEMREIRLPTWEVPREKYDWAVQYLADQSNFDADGKPLKRFDMMFAGAYKRYYELPEHFRNTRIFGVRLGGLLFMTFPFELFTEYADRVRMALPGSTVIDIQLSYENIGYLSTAGSASTYSTSIFNGACPPEAGEVLVAECAALGRSL